MDNMRSEIRNLIEQLPHHLVNDIANSGYDSDVVIAKCEEHIGILDDKIGSIKYYMRRFRGLRDFGKW